MWPMYIAMGIIAILIGVYLYRFVKRMCETFSVDIKTKRTKIIIYIVIVCLVLACLRFFSIGTIMLLHIMVTGWLMQLINFIVKKIAKERYRNGCRIWKFIYGSGIASILISVVIVAYGYHNMHNVVETAYTIYTEKDIRDEGYRIALIADVHYGVSLGYDEVLKKCQEISEKNPDIVVLCGDIVDDSTSRDDAKKIFQALSCIENKYGIFYVYGNHDRQLYMTKREYTEDELREFIEANGITILQDEIYAINEEFVIAGREDYSYRGDKARLTIDELLADVNKEEFVLTLDHQPKQYAENGAAGTDLLLSGHTHGGQIWPAQYLFALAKFDDAVYGYTQIDADTQAIVTSGFAGWGYPVKTAAPAEYVIIDILNKD